MLKIFSIFARPRRTRTTVYYIPDELPPYVAGETISAGHIMPLSEENVIYSPSVPFDAWIKILETNPAIVMGGKPAGWLAYIRVEDEKYYVLKDAWKVVNSKIVEGPKRFQKGFEGEAKIRYVEKT